VPIAISPSGWKAGRYFTQMNGYIMSIDTLRLTDPAPPNWASINLPPSWPDELKLNTLTDLSFLLSKVFGSRTRVQLPEDMPGKDLVPKYMLQEFHNLPNGYYSASLTRGYVNTFDSIMLGAMGGARNAVAAALAGVDSAIDIGCGGGRVAQSMVAQGIDDVWGLDPSPYLLKQAHEAVPDVKFVQGSAERIPFSDERFGGIGICFLLHEIPPKYASQALREFHRVLKPGGLISIAEPSPLQMEESSFALLKKYGWKGPYFKLLARMVFEPFVDAWHKRDLASWFFEHGFEMVVDDVGMPLRHIVVRKR